MNLNKKNIFILASFVFITIFLAISITINQKNINKEVVKVSNFFEHENYASVKKFFLNQLNSPYSNINYIIKKNDTLEKILKKFNLKNKKINEIIEIIKKVTNPNSLIEGKEINVILKKASLERNQVLEIIIPFKSKTIRVYRDKVQNKYFVEKIFENLKKEVVIAENVIKNNLYSSATKEGIQPNIIIEFARIFGFEIDFQRDIRKNDRFQILYEKFYDENDEVVKTGSILFAYMSVNGREISLYKFGTDKDYGYFNLNGKSVEKALMKTPINGARLSSPFGKRKHPILGFNKMHTGTDFAAPEGTPIMASGSGTIIRAKWCGGGGNCIKIKHNSTYETVYAHLKSFAKNIKVGKKIRQGEIIGYVGSTGMSTGPHLHYEVIINGKKVNSQKLNLPSGKILKGDQRKQFELHRIKTDVLISEVIKDSSS